MEANVLEPLLFPVNFYVFLLVDAKSFVYDCSAFCGSVAECITYTFEHKLVRRFENFKSTGPYENLVSR
jgi:hypothetical protein